MEGEPLVVHAELSRARQNLAEVIDECVFVERQRELTQQRLSAELKERDRLIVNLLSSLRSLAEYLSILEERIVVPAIGSFNAAVKQFTALGPCRASTIANLEATLRAHNSMHLMPHVEPMKEEYEKNVGEVLQDGETPFSLNDVYILIRSLLNEKYRMKERIDRALLGVPSLTQDHLHSDSALRSDETRELHQEFFGLTQEVEKNDEKLDSPQSFANIPSTIEEKKYSASEIQRPKDFIERQVRTIESPRVPNSVSQVQGDTRSKITEGEWTSKLKASELKIDALNKEISQQEEKYRDLETRFAKERAELLAELAEERKRKRDDHEESDAVLGRVTVELEHLVVENAQLKKRIRMKGAKKESVMSSV